MFSSSGRAEVRDGEWADASPEQEAREVLMELARRALSAALSEVLVAHAMHIGAEGDFAMKRAALFGMLDRVCSSIEWARTRPVRRLGGSTERAGGARFAVTLPGEVTREVWLESLTPLRSSCACLDFTRSGLGVCSHGLAVLRHLTQKRGAKAGRAPVVRPVAGQVLRWDPRRPMLGRYDALRGITLSDSGARGAALQRKIASSQGAARIGIIDALLAMSVAQEPACLPVLERERRAAVELMAASEHAPHAVRALASLKRTLYPYQRESVLRFLGAGSLLIADDMGLGKTTQAVAACHALLTCGAVARVLLVVPASLKAQWCREWQASTTLPITAVTGDRDERRSIYAGGSGVLAVGYEQLRIDLAAIRAFDPDMVVLDEAQRIKNAATKTARAVAELTPRYRLALTGTPMQNRLSELASVVSFVDPNAVGPTWQLIARHMFEVGDGGSGMSGARHLDELRERLSPVMVRRLRSEVLSQLPGRTDTRIPVTLTAAQIERHKPLEESATILMRIRKDRTLTKAERDRLMMLLGEQRRVCNGLAQCDFEDRWPELREQTPTDALLSSLDGPKLLAFRDLVRELVVHQRRKVVVFSEWRAMLRLAAWSVSDLLGDAGLESGFFTGAERPKLRERALVDFHDRPEMAALFLTDAGGVGLNLQRAASACIQLELPWNPAVMEQRIGRIHRLGQTQPIDVFHVVSEGGIESRIAEVLGRKAALCTALLDQDGAEVHFETSAGIFDLAASLEVPADGCEETFEPVDAPIEPAPDATATPPPHTAPPDVVLAPDVEVEPRATVADPNTESSPFVPRMVRRPDGGFSFDVPAELAGPMAALLASMAQALASANDREHDGPTGPTALRGL